jgi:hypothetical protein
MIGDNSKKERQVSIEIMDSLARLRLTKKDHIPG